MGLSTIPCDEFVAQLGSGAAVPGGGGASALVGALGTALGNMVGSLTVGKKKYASVEAEMYGMMGRCETLEKELLALIERDAQMFEPLSKAYSLPHDTDEEKAEKDKVMEQALKDACVVPIEIMEKCAESIDLIDEIAEKGSALAVSDAAAGAVFAGAAMQAAGLNVYINTKSMRDRACAGELNAKADDLLAGYPAKADLTYEKVLSRLKGQA